MDKKPSHFAVFGRTLRYYAPQAGAIAGALAFLVLAIGLNLLKPWPLKLIVDDVIGKGHSPGGLSKSQFLLVLSIALVAIHLLWGIFNLVNNYLLVKIGLKALLRVRCDLFAHLQRLSLKFHDSRKSADSMFRVSYDTQAVQSIFNRGFSTIFSAGVTLVGTVVVMLRMDPGLTLLALGITPLLVSAIYFFADRIRKQSTTISESESALSVRTQEGLTGIRVIHAFGREEYELERFEKQCMTSLKANLRLNFTHVSSALVVGSLMGAGTAAMIYFGARHVMEGTLTVGSLLVFISYLGMLYEPLQTLSYTSWALEDAAAGAQRVFEILDTPEEIKDIPMARSLNGVKGEIQFDEISFGYDPSHPILSNITLRIEPGRTTAFVGTTGAGKTTLLSLIPRFYDPIRGTLRLDGSDLRVLQKKSLRENIGMVLQDTMLLEGSVADNIGYGKLGAKWDAIENAARAARVDEFVGRLEKGFDSEVGERGVRLSVGQRQRIGIARAFLKNAPILLLDEPTSSLDPQTEQEIIRTLKELMRGRTTVLVSHRIATVHDSDWIYVLDKGQMVEQGKGPDLLKKGNFYARLYNAQVGIKNWEF